MFGQVQKQNQALSAMLNNVNVGQQQAAQAREEQRAERERRGGNGLHGGLDELKAVINPKLLEKTPSFSGCNQDFVEWTFTFGSITGLLGLEDGMSVAIDVATDGEITLAQPDEDSRLKSKALWFLLINSCKGKGLT
eukprot:1902603-Heterocapsa_arctica.AAC.1